LQGFVIRGRDGPWHWADAEIDGDTVVVASRDVPNPVHVRYAWADNPVCNLYNKAGLPASPFSTETDPVR
jgi:sialate O-acetylesterase